MVGGTDGDGKSQSDEDEYRRYDYKDPDLQFLRTRTRFWRRTTGGVRTRTKRRRNNNIRFSRTMMMSLISWISSTGS